MQTNVSRILCFILASFAMLSPCFGQEMMEQMKKSADEIARELANPNAPLGAFIFGYDHTWYGGNLPDASNQGSDKLVIQPSLPYPLGEGVNFFLRPLVPLYFSQPTYGQNGFEKKGFNLGDISADAAVGKTWKSGFVGVAGVFASFPTATDDALSANQTILGPEALAAFGGSWGFAGVLFTQGWGLTSNAEKPVDNLEGEVITDVEKRVSILSGQYFVVINLGDGWQFNCQPVWSYNWNASEGNRLTLPLPLGVKKTVPFGDTYVNLGLQYWYYAATPNNFGPKSQIRLTVTPLIPLPW